MIILQNMAVVDIPYSMDLHRYTANAMDVVLPLREFTESKENSVCFALSYKVEKEKQEADDEAESAGSGGAVSEAKAAECSAA